MRLLCFTIFAAVTVAQKCKDWKLPWGTYTGSLNDNNVCVYSNIRFASPPLGKLRFAAPSYPPTSNPPIPGSNPSCYQAEDVGCVAANPYDENAPSCFPKYYGTQSEDCLFLDVYVPSQAFEQGQQVPVVVWFYGGAYLFGSKTQYLPTSLPFYDGSGFIDTATKTNHQQQSIIYVRGNYRLGAFGWLAGSYMQQKGQPNAGLLDQRAILRFVHDHIAEVKGDPNTVSVWGESAGASSIMHHLVMPQNIKEPLFKRAILQSPAYQWLWNETDLNDTYTRFAKGAKCPTADMACLQSADTTVLRDSNQELFQKDACQGIMPVGPSVDGNLVPTLAPNRIGKKNIMALDTIAVSHVELEVPYPQVANGSSFIPLPIRQNPQSEAKFQDFLNEVFTGAAYTDLRKKISKRYPKSAYSDQVARAAAVITDCSFTCNTRSIIDTYLSTKTKVYAMDYALFSPQNGSTHASDLVPDFNSPATNYRPFLKCVSKATGLKLDALVWYIQSRTAPRMQQFFTDHAIWGDPNHNLWWNEYHWLPAYAKPCDESSMGTCVWNLLKPMSNVLSVFSENKGADLQTTSSVCDFWSWAAQEVSRLYGKDVGDGDDFAAAAAAEYFPEQLAFNEEL